MKKLKALSIINTLQKNYTSKFDSSWDSVESFHEKDVFPGNSDFSNFNEKNLFIEEFLYEKDPSYMGEPPFEQIIQKFSKKLFSKNLNHTEEKELVLWEILEIDDISKLPYLASIYLKERQYEKAMIVFEQIVNMNRSPSSTSISDELSFFELYVVTAILCRMNLKFEKAIFYLTQLESQLSSMKDFVVGTHERLAFVNFLVGETFDRVGYKVWSVSHYLLALRNRSSLISEAFVFSRIGESYYQLSLLEPEDGRMRNINDHKRMLSLQETSRNYFLKSLREKNIWNLSEYNWSYFKGYLSQRLFKISMIKGYLYFSKHQILSSSSKSVIMETPTLNSMNESQNLLVPEQQKVFFNEAKKYLNHAKNYFKHILSSESSNSDIYNYLQSSLQYACFFGFPVTVSDLLENFRSYPCELNYFVLWIYWKEKNHLKMLEVAELIMQSKDIEKFPRRYWQRMISYFCNIGEYKQSMFITSSMLFIHKNDVLGWFVLHLLGVICDEEKFVQESKKKILELYPTFPYFYSSIQSNL